MHFLLKVLIVTFTLFLNESDTHLHDTFSQFELLSPRHIVVRTERDTAGRGKHKRITLSIFGRKVRLLLTTGLKDGFVNTDNLYAFHANGTQSKIPLELDDFHHGIIKGYPKSRVTSWYHQGLWSIHCVHTTMSFSVEPFDFHSGSEWSRRMIGYRHRDIRSRDAKKTPFCTHFSYNTNASNTTRYTISKDMNIFQFPSIHAPRHENKTASSQDWNTDNRFLFDRRDRASSYSSNSSRKKRGLHSDKFCDIISVVDHTLVNGIGGGSVIKAVKLIIHAINIANDVFYNTNFLQPTKVGVKIRAMEVQTFPVYDFHIPKHGEDTVDARQIIMNLTHVQYFKDYCLVHYSTQRSFKDGAMGMALTPNLEKENNGSSSQFGICGGSTVMTNSLNIAVSSVELNQRVVTFTEFAIVTSHEIGHSFGAKHDEEGVGVWNCAPSAYDGGRYLMWHSMIQGIGKNNFKFSDCSITDISHILKRRSNCLVTEDVLDQNICGNGVLDYGEDCDSGLSTFFKDHVKCCTPQCRFTPYAVCSPSNYPCCKNCTVAPKGETCSQVDIEQECMRSSVCDGLQYLYCPPGQAKPNGSPCGINGECHFGECVDYCEKWRLGEMIEQPYKQCECDHDRREMCTVCCGSAVNITADSDTIDMLIRSSCESTGKVLRDGTPCPYGRCLNGLCTSSRDVDVEDLNNSFNVTKTTQHIRETNVDSAAIFVGLAHFVIIIAVCLGLTIVCCLC